ncbi:MAG: hypothetical protein IPK31_17055 [Chitinophagaceae bacterium]|nr:hypothetical protein [Chitinophagaceae bacterium]
MRTFISIISLLFSTLCFSQATTTVETVIVDSGKYEFKLQAKKDTADYSKAFRILTNQVKLNPKNAEYRYFLGYTIDRLNADDGKGMFQLKKGGFIEPILEFNRQLLKSCDKNAILVTYGDNITIPIWYLQTIENYRTDITVVDANLINTIWYSKYLKSERNLKISFSDAVIDTIEYKEWQSQQITVINSIDTTQKFSWELRPTYLDNYILKGDRILLDIFQQNFYSRPIYFNNNSDSSYNLFLTPYLVDEGLVNRVTTKRRYN